MSATDDPFTTASTGLTPGVETLARRGIKLPLGLPPGVETRALQANPGVPLNPGIAPPPLAPALPGGMTAPGNQEANFYLRGQAPSFSTAPTLPGSALTMRGAPPPFEGQSLLNPGAHLLPSQQGPKSYSAMGVGTNNPNAYRVGRNHKSVGVRVLERLARRGNGAAAAQLARMEFDASQASQGYDFTASRDQARHMNELEMYGLRRQDSEAARREGQDFARERDSSRQDFARERDSSRQDFQRGEYDRRRADEQSDWQRNRVPQMLPELQPGGAPMLINGQVVYPPKAPKSTTPELLPLPGTNQLVPFMGGTHIGGLPNFQMNPGWSVMPSKPQYVPAPKVEKPAKPEPEYYQDTEGKVVKLPPGYEAPEGWKKLKKATPNEDGEDTSLSGRLGKVTKLF